MDHETCIDRIRSGETEAARLLFAEYGEQIYRNALKATQSKEAARTITRETILELIGSLRTEPDKDGWDLWVESVSARHIEVHGLVDRDVQALGQEIFDDPPAEPEPSDAPAEPPHRSKEKTPRAPRRGEPAYDAPEEPELLPARQRPSVGSVLLSIVLVLGILLLVWIIVGLLMSFRVLPAFNLGYTWFNETLFRLFW